MVKFLYLGETGEGLPPDLDSLFTAKFTTDSDLAEGDYTLSIQDVTMGCWNGEEISCDLQDKVS